MCPYLYLLLFNSDTIRGGAIILRVGGNTASKASIKILGVVPTYDFLEYNSCNETYEEPIGQRYPGHYRAGW